MMHGFTQKVFILCGHLPALNCVLIRESVWGAEETFFLPFRLHLWLLWHTLSLVTDEIGKKDGEGEKRCSSGWNHHIQRRISNITHSLFLFQVRFENGETLTEVTKKPPVRRRRGENERRWNWPILLLFSFLSFPSAYYLFMHTRTNGLFGKPPSVGCQFGKESHTFPPSPPVS